MNCCIAMCSTRKNDKYLIECLRNIYQAYPDMYLFIHFDGCKAMDIASLGLDGVYSDLFNISQSDKRIGFANGINRVMDMIIKHEQKFDYIFRIDDDDLTTLERYDRQIEFMEARPHIHFSGTLGKIINEQGEVIDENWTYPAVDGPDMVTRFKSGGCHILHGSVVFRGSMLYDNHHLWYNPLYIAIEDYELWLRLLRLGYQYELLPERHYLYRSHGAQETRQQKQLKRNYIADQTHKYFKENWENFILD